MHVTQSSVDLMRRMFDEGFATGDDAIVDELCAQAAPRNVDRFAARRDHLGRPPFRCRRVPAPEGSVRAQWPFERFCTQFLPDKQPRSERGQVDVAPRGPQSDNRVTWWSAQRQGRWTPRCASRGDATSA